MSPALGQTRTGAQQQVAGQLELSSGRARIPGGATFAIPARAHRCPSDAATAQLVILDSHLVPCAAHFREWGEQLSMHGYQRMRTGALAPRQALQAELAGMHCIQELALLEANPPFVIPRAPQRVRRARERTGGLLADVDRAAFGERWHLDGTMLEDVRTATPVARRRIVTTASLATPLPEPAEPSPGGGSDVGPRLGAVAGFLISGRAARNGYIQRLAVHPEVRRCGVATSLLADALEWLRRRKADRVFVNTHVDNAPALALYRAHGFQDLPERLRVFEGPTQR